MFDTLEGISFFAKDRNFCLIYANPPFYQSLGLKSRKERLGKNDFELPPNSGQEIQEVRRVDNREVQAHDRPGRTIPKSSGDSGG
jgi:PAS domain-containing protein